MPSFDIVSKVDMQEVDNALNQARKEVSSRFDFKGREAVIEEGKDLIILRADDEPLLRSLREIVIGRLARRNVDLRNINQKDPEISPLGKARQELEIRQGLDYGKAKEITAAIRATGLKVQAQHQDRQIRVTGKKKDDLQQVIAALRAKEFGVALGFVNFRD